MPRIVLAVVLMVLAGVTAVVASYLVHNGPMATAVLRPAVEWDPSVVAGPPKVKLAVLVVFDQMRGDYLPRWKPHFRTGGFNRLMDDGCWFSQCLYPYATTTTGPGHAAILSGTTSSKTGIINNEWYDRQAGAQVYCAGAERFSTVGSGPAYSKSFRTHISSTKAKKGGATPDRLLSPSLGDNLKASGRGGKVIGVSLKDRSAILPTGHHADGAYWFNGEFVTSDYYTDVLPQWVNEFNASGTAEQWYGREWTRLRPDLDYDRIAGPDGGAGEANRAGLGVKFPHRVDGGKPTLTGSYYEALPITPFGNDLLLAFAKRCIDAEQLGQRGEADLLTISFSSNDLCGHAYGPDSQEVFDITLRSDRIMAELLAHLDATVGAGNYVVAVTADHGVCPLPEVQRTKRDEKGKLYDAKRIPQKEFRAKAEAALAKKYGPPIKGSRGPDRWIEQVSPPWIYLNLRQVESRKLNRNAVADTLAEWVRTQDGVSRVYTPRTLTQPPGDAIDRLVQASYHPERSGDLYVLLKEYYLLSDKAEYETGTSHGTPYHYDRHVPLVVFGPYVARGEQLEAVTPQHAAAILADALGLNPPADAVIALPGALAIP